MGLEILERRSLLAQFIVTTAIDESDAVPSEGTGLSLREAINSANGNPGADQITFDASVFAGINTIDLALGELRITESLTITGTGQDRLKIDALGNSRALNFSARTGNLSLSDLTITGGKTTGRYDHGAGIRFISSGTLLLTNTLVSSSNTTDYRAYGAGVYSEFGAVTLIGSTISGNTTAGYGARAGGLYTQAGALTLTNSTVTGNRTTGGFSAGGGIYSRSGSLSLTGSTLSNNSTVGYASIAGGAYVKSGAVTLTNSTVSGNSTSGGFSSGGGIYSRTGVMTLTNSTVTGNKVTGIPAVGGGILSKGTLVVQNSIVASNTAASVGGSPEIYAEGTLSIRSSLIGDNTGSTMTAAPVGSPDANGNIIGTGSAKIDPKLGPLAFNGGLTQTHALLPGSPAINAGNTSLVPAPLLTDQRGTNFVRRIGVVDMGSFELQTSSIVLNAAGEAIDLATTLRSLLVAIELIDIRGTGSNSLVLDILTISLYTPDRKLVIIAEHDDRITFGTGWTIQRPTFINGTFTHVIIAQASSTVQPFTAAEGEASMVRVELRNDRLLQNPLNVFDVDRDGKVLPLDALRVINEIRRRGPGLIDVPTVDSEISNLYYDVSGDNSLTALDALRIINAIAHFRRLGQAEAEQLTSSLVKSTPTQSVASLQNELLEQQVAKHSGASLPVKVDLHPDTSIIQTGVPVTSIRELSSSPSKSTAPKLSSDLIDEVLADAFLSSSLF